MVIAASIAEDIFRAILQGTPPGTVYALVALGFVLTYKTSGVFNLAFGAQAYVSAALYFKLHTTLQWHALPAALVAVVLVAPGVGLLLERLIFRNLRTAAALPRLVLTIGLSVALPSLFDRLVGYQVVAGKTPEGLVPDGTVLYDPFGIYAFTRNELVAMGGALLAAAALAIVFRSTALGLQMRAVVESRRMAELHGVAADRVSATAWALSSFFAGLAGVLIAPRFQTLVAGNFFQLMVVAIAGAAVGGLASLPLALAGGLGLGIFIAEVNTFLPRWSAEHTWLQPLQNNIAPAIPFIVLFVVVLVVPSIRESRQASDPLAGIDPPPRRTAAPGRRPGRAALARLGAAMIATGAIGAVVLARADSSWLLVVTEAVIMSIVFLSITVVTGMGGEISLCQGAYAAIGAYAVFQLSAERGVPPMIAALAGAVIAAAVGAALSLPVRRLGGVWTAIGTLAFAFFFDSVVVQLAWVSGGSTLFSGSTIPRPTIGPFDLASDKSFLVFTVVLLAVVAVVVSNLKRGTFGRTLSAVSGSVVGAQSIGISRAKGRLLAFTISGFIAALGGSLLAIQQENVNYGTNFTPFLALFWIVIVAVLGIRSVKGALVAGAAYALFDPLILKGALLEWILRDADRLPGIFPIDASWVFILFGLGAIRFARHPEGLLEASAARRSDRRSRRAADAVPSIASPPAPSEAGLRERQSDSRVSRV